MSYVDVLLSLGAAALIFGFIKLYTHRRKFKDLPQPPGHSLLWGHLKIFGETVALFPPRCHPQLVLTHMKKTYDLPEIFYVDLWPLGPVFLASTSVDSLNLVDTHLSMGKHAENNRILTPLLGRDSIPALNGRVWQQVHHMLQPAFKPQSIKQLLSKAATEAAVFCGILERLAETGKVVSMETMTGRMLFEINAKTIVGMPFNAQQGGCQIVDDLGLPAEVWHQETQTWNLVKKMRLRGVRTAALKRSTDWLVRMVNRRYQELKAEDSKNSNNILDNCLIGRIEAEQQGDLKPLAQDKAWMDLFIVNLKALMFGGQGTSNDTLLFALSLLSTHPECLKAIRDEHDRVAGPNFVGAVNLLTNQPQRTTELEYTTGVLKETLRLFPVGFTAKMDDKTQDQFLDLNGKRYPTFGQDTMIAQVSHACQYDAANFPNPDKFEPARWTAASPYPTPDNNAFRSFSKGARACMGRELAMDELRGLLLCLMRWFDFELADLNPSEKQRVPWMDLDTKLGDFAFQELGLEAKPRGGAMMRVKRTERPWGCSKEEGSDKSFVQAAA